MAYDGDKDFAAISDGAKKSPAFQKMAGTEPDADDAGGGDETMDLSDAWQAAQEPGGQDAFVASMLSAIKSCIANYGSKK